MAKTLTARLDDKSAEELASLSKALGVTESEIVRNGIHLLAASHSAKSSGQSGFVGVGKFASGRKDTASNKKHLDDFAR